MNKVNKGIESFARLTRLLTIFQRVNQISWTADQSRKRYPAPEALTDEEIESLVRLFLALGMDLPDIVAEWQKEYDEYKKLK